MGRLLRAATFVLSALALAGCLSSEPKVAEIEQVSAEQRQALTATEAEGADGAAGGEVHTFVAIDIDYSDAPSEVPAGTVSVEMVNEGTIIHNVVLEELDDRKILEAEGGQTDSAEVELEPGALTYYCDIPGHRAAGMEGTLTVTG